MGSVRTRQGTGKLYFDFRYRGQRYREQTALDDTLVNRRKMHQILARLEAEITLGTFRYDAYFPNSSNVDKAGAHEQDRSEMSPLFGPFAEDWLRSMKVQWRQSHFGTVELTLRNYLIPEFGDKPLSRIGKADLLAFRSALADIPGKSGKGLSAERINHIMTPLRMILGEASERFGFPNPYRGIKSLKVPRTEVEPFSLDEVNRILANVRADFRPYYTVRFFTGMRTAEIDGLKWRWVDFERRQILIRETVVAGREESTKTEGSQREIDMSQPVFDALRVQQQRTGEMVYVFANREGKPLGHNNVTRRVWYPLLRYLGLRPRRPYQTRHTAATLWLAAGENPEWIARQMGHTTTEMLFRVYSRYVPNLTRRDGSAFERLLKANPLVTPEADDE